MKLPPRKRVGRIGKMLWVPIDEALNIEQQRWIIRRVEKGDALRFPLLIYLGVDRAHIRVSQGTIGVLYVEGGIAESYVPDSCTTVLNHGATGFPDAVNLHEGRNSPNGGDADTAGNGSTLVRVCV